MELSELGREGRAGGSEVAVGVAADAALVGVTPGTKLVPLLEGLERAAILGRWDSPVEVPPAPALSHGFGGEAIVSSATGGQVSHVLAGRTSQLAGSVDGGMRSLAVMSKKGPAARGRI